MIWSARRRWPRDSIPRIYAGYCLERLVDEAARITGIDRIEIRCRNLIAPARMPYKTAVGTTYDSGDFATVFDEALASADVAGFGARQVSPNLAGAPSEFGSSLRQAFRPGDISRFAGRSRVALHGPGQQRR